MKALSILVALLVIQPLAGDIRQGGFGASGTVSPATAQQAPAATKGKRVTYPFSGEVESYDSGSLTLKGKKKPRVLLLTSETRVNKNGSRFSLKQIQPGERVSGSARKNAEGKEVAVTVNLKGQNLAPQ